MLLDASLYKESYQEPPSPASSQNKMAATRYASSQSFHNMERLQQQQQQQQPQQSQSNW